MKEEAELIICDSRVTCRKRYGTAPTADIRPDSLQYTEEKFGREETILLK